MGMIYINHMMDDSFKLNIVDAGMSQQFFPEMHSW